MYEVEVTPGSAGWGYSSLLIVQIAAGETHQFSTGEDEVIVVPLSGSVSVETEGAEFCSLVGRENVFAGPTDVVYLAPDSTVELYSEVGGRFALCGARARSGSRPAIGSHGDSGRAARGGAVQPAGAQLRHPGHPGRPARSSLAR